MITTIKASFFEVQQVKTAAEFFEISRSKCIQQSLEKFHNQEILPLSPWKPADGKRDQTLVIRIPDTLYQSLKESAVRRGCSLSVLIRSCLKYQAEHL